MAYVSNRNMILGEHTFEKGQMIPDPVIETIPPLRFGSLTRVKHIVEVPDEDLGDTCEICGEGPFTRIARHMTAKHDNSEDILFEETVGLAEALVVVSEESVGPFAEEE